MAERSDDCSSGDDMESGPVEDPPLLVSPHRGEGQQSTEQQRSGDTGRQVQGVLTEPASGSSRLPLVDRHKGLSGSIPVVSFDLKQTCLFPIKDKPHGLVRLDDEARSDYKARPGDRVRPDKVGPDGKVRPDDEIRPDIENRGDEEIRPINDVQRIQEIKLDTVVRPDRMEQSYTLRKRQQLDMVRSAKKLKVRSDKREIIPDDKVSSEDETRPGNGGKPNAVKSDRGIEQEDEGRSDKMKQTYIQRKRQQTETIRSTKKVRPDSENTPGEDIWPDSEAKVGNEIRPNSLQSEVSSDSGECVMQADIFREAAQSGDVQTVKNYLHLGFPPDLVDEQGWSILHHAALNGQVDVMRLLHSKGCCVDPRDRHGRTPLHHAASSGACASIGVLVAELGSEVNPVDEDGFTPLERSVECKQYAAMEDLLRCGGMPVFLDEKSVKAIMLFQVFQSDIVQHVLTVLHSGWPIDVVASRGWNALHCAAGAGAVERIHFLVKCGFDVNRADTTGRTALHVAAQYGHQEVVTALVAAGCSIDVVDSDGWNALHYAALGGAVEMIDFLRIKCGFDVNRADKTGRTALHVAAQCGHQEVVTALVDAGCSIVVVDSDGWNALHYAAFGGAVEMIDFLRIKCGFDVNRADKIGRTALHAAAEAGHQEAVSALVDAGCPIDVSNSNGCNALHYAARSGAVEMIDFLINDKCGLDVNTGDRSGRTALHAAAQYGHQEVVTALVDAGCSIDVVDSNGWNALHYAALGGAVEMIDFFIKCGLDVNAVEKKDGTPLHAACAASQSPIVLELLRHGALLTKVSKCYGTPLHQAAASEFEGTSIIDDILAIIVESYPGHSNYPDNTKLVDMRDLFGCTAAVRAMREGRISKLESLVANNCDLTVRSKVKFSVFECAIENNKFSQLQAIAKACRVDDDSTSQGELLRTLQAKDLLDPSKLLILGAIGGDPLVLDFLSGEEDMFGEAAHKWWSGTYCRMLLDYYYGEDDKDAIYDNLCLPSECPLTPLQIAVICLKYRTEYSTESEITRIAQAQYFIQKLICHPVSKFIVNVRFHNGLSPLDVAQQFGLHAIAEMIESAGGRPGMWADLPRKGFVRTVETYSSLKILQEVNPAAVSRIVEQFSPQLAREQILCSKPQLETIIKHILPNLRHLESWFEVGGQLGVSVDMLTAIEKECGAIQTAYRKILTHWLEHGSQVSWESLFDALDTFERGKTVKEMKAKVSEELQPSAVTSPPTPSPVPMPLALPPHHGVQTLAISGPAPHGSREGAEDSTPVLSDRDFVPYLDDMISNILVLGVSLGIGSFTESVLNDPGRNDSKCLKVVKEWLRRTQEPTWSVFCEQLKDVKCFKHLVHEIERKQCTA